VHSVEMQIGADAMNNIARFHFIAHYKSGGWIFHRELYLWHPPHSSIILIRRQQPIP